MAHPVLPYGAGGEELCWVNLSAVQLPDLQSLLASELGRTGKQIAAGGYGEDRSFYRRSPAFANAEGEYRSVHLGLDFWASAGTPVCAPFAGRVHSWADNAADGDYGPTILLAHEGIFALYGHLSRASLEGLQKGQEIPAGQAFAALGDQTENGNWLPHLHFQLIRELGHWRGDFPGVALPGDRQRALANSPDPAEVLGLLRGA